MDPVGEGAIRVTTERSDIEIGVPVGDVSPPGAGAAAPLSTGGHERPSLADIARWFVAQGERQAERWALWTPVAFGIGAAAYFDLPREPMMIAAIAALAVAAGLILMGRWSRWLVPTIGLTLVGCAVAGFGMAKLRTESVKAAVAATQAGPERLEGWVVDVRSPGAGGQRLLIAPARIGGWAPEATPVRVRVTLRGGYVPSPGEPIRLLAMINTPPPPASPGAYDFARDAYFQSVGGVGFALGPAQTWETSERPHGAWPSR
jgi:competence protein ComEC